MDESTPLVAPRDRRGRALAAGAALVAACGLAGLAYRQPTALFAVASEATEAAVYEILVTRGMSMGVACPATADTGAKYGLCGDASCSGVDGATSLATCTSPAVYDSSARAGETPPRLCYHRCQSYHVDYDTPGAFLLSGSNVFLSKSLTYRKAVMEVYETGQLSAASTTAFCDALVDGTICDESGLGCQYLSYQTNLRSGGDVAYSQATGTGPTCMGAPCWASDGGAGDCDLVCLCPNPMAGVALGDDAPDASTCVTHDDDYTTVASQKEADILYTELVAAGASGAPPAPLPDCEACSIIDRR